MKKFWLGFLAGIIFTIMALVTTIFVLYTKAANEIDDNVLAVNEELEGAIFDLSISVDQAYTRDPRGGLA